MHEDRDSAGMTAFHHALRLGHADLVEHFLANYSPKEDYNKAATQPPVNSSFLRLAAESGSLAVVKLVLDADLANAKQATEIWSWLDAQYKKEAASDKGKDWAEIRKAISKVPDFKPPTPIAAPARPAAAKTTAPPRASTASAPDRPAPAPVETPKPSVVDELVGMGFAKVDALNALRTCKGNVDRAVDLLLTVSNLIVFKIIPDGFAGSDRSRTEESCFPDLGISTCCSFGGCEQAYSSKQCRSLLDPSANS